MPPNSPKVTGPLGPATETGVRQSGTWHFSILATGGISLAGLALDAVLRGRGFPAPSWPDNLWLLLLFLGAVLLVFFALRHHRLMNDLAGGRLAVCTLAALSLWGVLLGSFPQVVQGMEAPLHQRILHSPAFLFLLLLLCANLGWSILRHATRGWSWSSLFLCNHAGVFIVVVAGTFGSGDLRRLDVWIQEGQLVWYGTDGSNTYELPFAIHLHHFRVEYFPPVLTVIDTESAEFLLPRGTDPLSLANPGGGRLLGYEVEVLESTMEAPWSVPGDSVPAARIRVRSPSSGEDAVEGWVSSGSYIMPPLFVTKENVTFAMPIPRSRLYQSTVTIVLPESEPVDRFIEVNRPVRVEGWWLYQKGYDLSGGPRARRSQIEAVRDPWLPVVYTGLAFMAAGAFLALLRASTLLRASVITLSTPEKP